MKDKSRFLSSVIVSLLAGFIYYLSGSDIQQTIERSFKAVFSQTDTEMYGPQNSASFTELLKKSGIKVNKNKIHFYYSSVKKKRDNFKNENAKTPDNTYGEFISLQAKVMKSCPDKNVDFTNELNNLIRKNSDCNPDSEKYIKMNRNVKSSPVADLKAEDRKIQINISKKENKKFYHKTDEENSSFGFGFEYNNVKSSDENCPSDENNHKNVYEGRDYRYKIKNGIDFKTSYKKVKSFDNDQKKNPESDNSEINMEDSELGEESM